MRLISAALLLGLCAGQVGQGSTLFNTKKDAKKPTQMTEEQLKGLVASPLIKLRPRDKETKAKDLRVEMEALVTSELEFKGVRVHIFDQKKDKDGTVKEVEDIQNWGVDTMIQFRDLNLDRKGFLRAQLRSGYDFKKSVLIVLRHAAGYRLFGGVSMKNMKLNLVLKEHWPTDEKNQWIILSEDKKTQVTEIIVWGDPTAPIDLGGGGLRREEVGIDLTTRQPVRGNLIRNE